MEGSLGPIHVFHYDEDKKYKYMITADCYLTWLQKISPIVIQLSLICILS